MSRLAEFGSSDVDTTGSALLTLPAIATVMDVDGASSQDANVSLPPATQSLGTGEELWTLRAMCVRFLATVMRNLARIVTDGTVWF